MLRIDRFRPRLKLHRPRKLVGLKPPLKLKDVWAVRMRLRLSGRLRDLALFNLAIDSRLRGCDLVVLRVHDVFHSAQVTAKAIIMQRKTGRPAHFKGHGQRGRRGLHSRPGFITKGWFRMTNCL